MATSRRITTEMYNKRVAYDARRNDIDKDYYVSVSEKFNNVK